jgi:hypothetical protein
MTTDSDLSIVFNVDSGGAEAKFVRERLDLYNVGQTGISTWYPVNFFVKSARGETLGGVMGAIWGGWLQVGFLWVAEAYARERGCHSVLLDTHSFQARPFYEGRGYEVFGTLDDFPKGHKKFFLRKKL